MIEAPGLRRTSSGVRGDRGGPRQRIQLGQLRFLCVKCSKTHPRSASSSSCPTRCSASSARRARRAAQPLISPLPAVARARPPRVSFQGARRPSRSDPAPPVPGSRPPGRVPDRSFSRDRARWPGAWASVSVTIGIPRRLSSRRMASPGYGSEVLPRAIPPVFTSTAIPVPSRAPTASNAAER
ncbi:MAG: hypothetical protein MZU79_00500 [Anaerotruncus sp.]|nr:hypothetical protein [Anaerotruncus sp.]